ncbi:MAG: UDP-N-acetylmuramate dehydrogenase [Patescibacteria group bacterium]|nr:UDP-N-acetylmuramate dehydrogenase [Patescibacteria group bacterium]
MIKILKNKKIANFITFKLGGRAEFFCLAKNLDEIIEAIKWAKKRKIKWQIFAGGSNVIFPDKLIKGLLICIRGGRNLVQKDRLIVDAGVPLVGVVKKSISLGLKGLELLSGIPGTAGGAIVGNAGAYGYSISEVVEKVEVWNEKRKAWLNNKECHFAYRESVFKKKSYVVLRIVLKFKKGNKKELQKISQSIIKQRNKKFNLKLKCPGSYFKNILVESLSKKSLKLIDKNKIKEGKVPAGYLLEQVGAKGMQVGKIKVADFHGNMIMNLGSGRTKDVKKLAGILKNKVWKKFGIKLKEEVRYF